MLALGHPLTHLVVGEVGLAGRLDPHPGILEGALGVGPGRVVMLSEPDARVRDLGSGYYASRVDKDRKTRNHIRQLEALGYTVTLAPAA